MACDGVELLGREAQRREQLARQLGRAARRLVTRGVVLRQVHQVVQIAGRRHHQAVGFRVVCEQGLGVAPDAVEVGAVVGTVGAGILRRQRTELCAPGGEIGGGGF